MRGMRSENQNSLYKLSKIEVKKKIFNILISDKIKHIWLNKQINLAPSLNYLWEQNETFANCLSPRKAFESCFLFGLFRSLRHWPPAIRCPFLSIQTLRVRFPSEIFIAQQHSID